MKRRTALLALLLAPLSACMPGGQPPASSPDVVYESSAPLRARLLNTPSGLSFNVSHAAHIAVFEVVPGQGMGLVYPAYGSDRGRFSSGYNRVFMNRMRPYTWYYTGTGMADRIGPRYYLLVASRSPLQLGRFQGDPSALRQHFGFRRFAALNPRPAMDELVNLVVPAQGDEDWDTDLLTVWPQDNVYGMEERRLVRVVCNNGYVITTEWENAHLACLYFNRQPQQVPPVQPDTTGEERPDSVQVPTRRRPEPRSTDDEAQVRPRERVRVENWRQADGGAPDGLVRRPQPRPEDRGDDEPTPSVRRVPVAPRDPETEDGGRRAGPQTRRESPRGSGARWPEGGVVNTGSASPGSGTTRAAPRREEPRRETPRETTRETPRAAPARPEPVRSEPAARPAPSGGESRGRSARGENG